MSPPAGTTQLPTGNNSSEGAASVTPPREGWEGFLNRSEPKEAPADESASPTDTPPAAEPETTPTAEPERPAEEAPPAKSEAQPETGKPPEAAGETPEPLLRLLKKFGTPENLATGYLNLRGLQKATADDLGKLQALFDEHFEIVEGQPVLRTDVAARRLSTSRRQEAAPVVGEPDEASIRAQIAQEYEEALRAEVVEEDLPQALKLVQRKIDQDVKAAVAHQKELSKSREVAVRNELMGIIDQHLKAHPDDRKILKEIEARYMRFPDEVVDRAILEGWLPFDEVARSVRLERGVNEALVAAFDEGRKFERDGVKGPSASTGGGAPGPTPAKRAGAEDGDDAMKLRIIEGKAIGRQPLESIFKQ